MKFVLAILVAVGLFGLRQEPEAPATVAPVLEDGAELCPTCSGRGFAEMDCGACDGTQRAACPHCAGSPLGQGTGDAFRPQRLAAAIDNTRPEDRDRLREYAALQASSEITQVARRLTSGPWRMDPAGLEPGRVACPKGCFLDHSVDRCRTCKNEHTVECGACEGAGERECSFCESGRVHKACETCRGHGQVISLDALETASPIACPFCELAPKPTCASCAGDGVVAQACRACHGLNKELCSGCGGAARLLCGPCFGRGVAFTTSPSEKPDKCGECRGKGSTKCKECSKGLVQCANCGGSRTRKTSCTDCFRGFRSPCLACLDGVSRPWKVTAERAFAAGRANLGWAWLEVGLHREKSYLRKLAVRQKKIGEDPGAGPIAQEIERVEGRLEALRHLRDNPGSHSSPPANR